MVTELQEEFKVIKIKQKLISQQTVQLGKNVREPRRESQRNARGPQELCPLTPETEAKP